MSRAVSGIPHSPSQHSHPSIYLQRFVVDIRIRPVVVRRGSNRLIAGVRLQASREEARVPADFFANDIQRFMGSETCGAIRKDLWEQLLEGFV